MISVSFSGQKQVCFMHRFNSDVTRLFKKKDSLRFDKSRPDLTLEFVASSCVVCLAWSACQCHFHTRILVNQLQIRHDARSTVKLWSTKFSSRV